MMHFCHVTLQVKKLDASIRFYTEAVGLPVEKRFRAGPDTEIAFLGSGETKVELVCGGGRTPAAAADGISMGFEVRDASGKLESLKSAGVPVVSGMIQPNPHVRFFYALDPDGFRVQFLENL